MIYRRIIKDNAPEQESVRPQKRRRLTRGTKGVHSADMAVISPSNFSSHSGWVQTPTGRLMRPMRLRPARPLPEPTALPPTSTSSAANKKGAKMVNGTVKVKKRKKTKEVIRARRRLIDPLAWGSEYLKGDLLEGSQLAATPGVRMQEEGGDAANGDGDDDEDDSMDVLQGEGTVDDDAIADSSASRQISVPLSKATLVVRSSPVAPSPPPTPRTQSGPTTSAAMSLADEAAQTLSLLSSLFDASTSKRVGEEDGDEDDWGGEESLSDVDMDLIQQQLKEVNVGPGLVDEIEVVPRTLLPNEKRQGKRREKGEIGEVEGNARAIGEGDNMASVTELALSATTPQTAQTKTLKDMFAPRAEDGTST